MSSTSSIRPSSMTRTVNCPGHIKMSQGLPPEEDTPDAMEGTAVHWAAVEIYSGKELQPELTVAPNGIVLSQEMIDAATDYVSILPKGGVIESPIGIDRLYKGIWGTPDYWCFYPQRSLLDVYDLKFGRVGVDPYENWQEMAYSVGILDAITGNNALSEHLNIKVRLNIFQPRRYDGKPTHTAWEINSVDLRPYVNVMSAACHEALDNPAPMIRPGLHCYKCPSMLRCDANKKANALFVEYATATASHQDRSLGEMSQELMILDAALRMVNERHDLIEQRLIDSMMAGKSVPGRTLRQGYGHSKWTLDESLIIEIGHILGLDLKKKDVAVTPAEAKRRAKAAGVGEETLEPLYTRYPTNMKLVVDDEERVINIFKNGEIPND